MDCEANTCPVPYIQNSKSIELHRSLYISSLIQFQTNTPVLQTVRCSAPNTYHSDSKPFVLFPLTDPAISTQDTSISLLLAVTPLIVYICMIVFVKEFIGLQAGMSFTAEHKPIASFCSVDIHALPLIPKTHMFVSYILAALSPFSVFL